MSCSMNSFINGILRSVNHLSLSTAFLGSRGSPSFFPLFSFVPVFLVVMNHLLNF